MPESDSHKKEVISTNPERVVFQNSRDQKLVGDFYHSDGKSVIIMSHGLAGDRHEGGRFDKTAEEFNKAGYNVFKFDFSGSGESDDDNLTPEKEIDDLRSALVLIRERGFSNIALLGLSFGAFVSASVWDEDIKTMVFWAPVTNASKNPEDHYGKEGIEELRLHGRITRQRDNGSREQVVIDKKLFDEWRHINQEELLSKIKCPVLILHGDNDFRVPLQDSKTAITYLPSNSELNIIKGADHIFNDHVDDFVSQSQFWLDQHLNT